MIAATTMIHATSTLPSIPTPPIDDFLSLYPNPGNSTLAINLHNGFKGEVEIQFHNALGQLTGVPVRVHKQETELILTLETSHLPAGEYMVHFTYAARKQTRN